MRPKTKNESISIEKSGGELERDGDTEINKKTRGKKKNKELKIAKTYLRCISSTGSNFDGRNFKLFWKNKCNR